MTKLITVYIPTYNRAPFLQQALNCLRRQTIDQKLLRIVVADNCSTDNTEATVRFFDDLDIVYIKRQQNIGQVANLNSMTEFLDTPYLQLLCDDDLLAPFHLKFLLEQMEADSTVGLFGGGIHYGKGIWDIDLHRGDLRLGGSYVQDDGFIHWRPTEWLAAHSITSAVSITASLIRTSVLQQVKPLFDSKVAKVSDRWLMAQIGTITKCVTHPWPTCMLRVHGANIAHGSVSPDLIEQIRQSAELTLDLASGLKIDIAEFWSRYLESNQRDEIKALIHTAYRKDISRRILGEWQPPVRRLDRLPIPNSMRNKIRKWRI